MDIRNRADRVYLSNGLIIARIGPSFYGTARLDGTGQEGGKSVMSLTRRAYLGAIVLMLTSIATAGDVPFVAVADLQFAPTEMVCLFVVPDGSGATFTEARVFGGQQIDATIQFRLVDRFGTPIPFYPHDDVWLDFASGTSAACGGWLGFTADADADIDGMMRFSQSPRGGGASSESVYLMIAGARAYSLDHTTLDPFAILVNSPDIDGGLQVNLTDVAMFAHDLVTGGSFRSDFNWDGAVNLTDVTMFAQHLGAACE
jgi:hypothetical protein